VELLRDSDAQGEEADALDQCPDKITSISSTKHYRNLPLEVIVINTLQECRD
jgi:hypothetical protein